MNTPVLTKKQQRQSLSAKKGPIKGARNVLAQPYTTYWPVVKGDQSSALQNILEELTPALKRPVRTIPRSQRRCTSKEERANAIESTSMEENTVFNSVLDSVILGVNAVTRALEKDNVCCILLEATVEPQHLIKHVVTMAQNKKIPVLLASFLKSVTLKCVGFSTAAFALKITVKNSEDHYFYNLYKKVLDVFNEFPVPKSSLRLFNDNDVSSNRHETSSIDDERGKLKVIISTDVYKYRSSTKERVFVPKAEQSSTRTRASEGSNFGSDFISMGYESDASDSMVPLSISKNIRYTQIHEGKNDPTIDSCKFASEDISTKKKYKKTDTSYISLKVKRLQGNSNRIKATKVSKRKKK